MTTAGLHGAGQRTLPPDAAAPDGGFARAAAPDAAVPDGAAPPRDALEAAGSLLRALSAPARMSIVLHLRGRECCVHDLVDALELPQPLVSQHLRVLKTAGVVHGERSGREVRYRLVDAHLAHIVTDALTHAQECAADGGTR